MSNLSRAAIAWAIRSWSESSNDNFASIHVDQMVMMAVLARLVTRAAAAEVAAFKNSFSSRSRTVRRIDGRDRDTAV